METLTTISSSVGKKIRYLVPDATVGFVGSEAPTEKVRGSLTNVQSLFEDLEVTAAFIKFDLQKRQLSSLRQKLRSFSELASNWDGQGAVAPSRPAITNAAWVLDELVSLGRLPDRLVADVEGGVGVFIFGGGEKKVWICCDNENGIAVVRREGSGQAAIAEEVASESDLERECEAAVRFVDSLS